MGFRHATRTGLAAVLTTLAATVMVLGGAAPVAQAVTAVQVRAIDPASYEERVLRLINEERARRGLPILRLQSCTDQYSERWSRRLADTSSFRHQSLDPFFDDCGARYAGETLARGTSTPRAMVTAWMQSDSHRRVMLSQTARRLGVAATLDSEGRWVLTVNYTRF